MTIPEALASLAAHDEAQAARRAHEAAVRTWTAGKPPAPKGARPAAPEAPRPAPDAVTAARATADAARTADEVARRARAALADVEKRHAAAEADDAAAKAEAARCVALVDGVRSGPSTALRQQLAHLGDTGRFRLSVDPDGDLDAEIVSEHGDLVPALDASGGERLAAGADFRIAVRRALVAGCKPAAGIPILLDARGDYSGDIPDAAPMVALVTEPGEGLSVVVEGGEA